MTTPDILIQWANCMKELEAVKAENAALREELEAVKTKVPTDEKQWFSNKEASKFTNMSVGWLNKDRMTIPPVIPFTKAGHRKVSYERADLQAFLDARKSRKKGDPKK